MGSVLPHLPQSGGGVVLCCELVIVKMTVMFQRSPAQTNGSLAKGERKRSMPPPVSTSPPLKKAKTSSVVKEEQKEKEKEKKEESLPPVVPARESGGLVSQGCQTLPPSSRIGSNCKHGDEEDEVCPIGTPVNLPATVWYEDRDGLLVVNVTWRGRTYVGTLMDSTKSEHIAEQYSGRIRQSNEKETESSQKQRVEEAFEEEEEKLPEKSLRERKTSKPKVKVKREKSKEKEEKKMYRCEKCDKEYKYPSGLSYHNKNTHEKIRTERESV